MQLLEMAQLMFIAISVSRMFLFLKEMYKYMRTLIKRLTIQSENLLHNSLV